jgi:hypothetical protein
MFRRILATATAALLLCVPAYAQSTKTFGQLPTTSASGSTLGAYTVPVWSPTAGQTYQIAVSSLLDPTLLILALNTGGPLNVHNDGSFTGSGGSQSGATSTITSVSASTSSVSLLASNSNRKGVIIVNDSASANLYIAWAASATTSAYTVKVTPGGTYEFSSTIYTGAISGIWDAASGAARITEVTP